MGDHGTIEPHFWVADLARARRFYEDALGFRVVESFPPDAPSWFQMGRGAAKVMITTLPDPAKATGTQSYAAGVAARRGGGAAALYLHVESVDAVHEACVAADAVIREPLWNPWWGGRQFTVADPDGNWWSPYQHDVGGPHGVGGRPATGGERRA